ncbi:TerD family protein [Streptomyces sp. NBC_00344]|uniref:TerD family protein n=1 Tax=Streptomyces sp. NBC_00344 TaxID=2975720 RepID=UPI002E1B8544
MHELIKGANVGLPQLSDHADSVVISLSWSSPSGEGEADVSVLMLDENRKVRSNADFYFYNNPVASDGSVQLLGATPTDSGSEDRIRLDLTAIPSDVQRVIIAASRYRRARFGELENLRLTLSDRVGECVLGFSISGAGAESAFVFGEIYRREDVWKFRAVGQGYDTGLAGLATDYGIEIDEDDAQDDDAQTELAPTVTTAGQVPTPRTPEAVKLLSAANPAAGSAAPPDVSVVPHDQPAPVSRLRTAKKKITLPRAPRPTLAENESWRLARLFPASSLKNDRERETRATSVLLSVMAQVPEFGRRLTAAFGTPAGRMETFTEVSLPHGETPKRPDGIVRVERAGKLWTALVETKTNGNPLKSEQIQDYMNIAARRGYEAVVTISNDVALEGTPLVDVKLDGRRKHKVGLWHLSWAEVAHQAQRLILHEGVRLEPHAWLLQELLHYLQHENSGCHGFLNMGPAWVPVRRAIDDDTLCPGDLRAVRVVESWERLVQQVCLRLGGELGRKVAAVRRSKRGVDPQTRRTELADSLCEDGLLKAEIRIDGAPGNLTVVADLRMGRLRTSILVPASDQTYPLARVKRLMKLLSDAPADLHVQAVLEGDTAGPRGTLEKLRPEPGDLVPKGGGQISGFRLTLSKSVGITRGNAESGFIRSVDAAVDAFCTSVITRLEQRVQ